MKRLAYECRSEIKGNTLVGYAAVYDEQTDRVAHGHETIGRGAFDDVLKREPDVRALIEHDPAMLLGRTRSGTLRVGSDDHGLHFEVDIPDTQPGRDVRVLLERGDLTGASFGFIPGQVERVRGGVVHRSVEDLLDVSVVAFPAYDGTAVKLRNADPRCVRENLIRARWRVISGGM